MPPTPPARGRWRTPGNWLRRNEIDRDPRLLAAFEALLEVLPVSSAVSGVELKGDAAAAGSDFEALDNLRRFGFADRVAEPEQLGLWQRPAAAEDARTSGSGPGR